MAIKYYMPTPDGKFTEVPKERVQAYYAPSFGIKADRKLKKGDRVKLDVIPWGFKQLEYKKARVKEVENGLPVSLELPSGKIIPVIGLILELLTSDIFARLWYALKDLFRKDG